MDPIPLPSILPCWAVVNVLGHSTYEGHVDLVDVAGGPMLRVTCPAVDATPPERNAEGEVVKSGKFALAEKVVILPRTSLHSIEITDEADIRDRRARDRRTVWGDPGADDEPF